MTAESTIMDNPLPDHTSTHDSDTISAASAPGTLGGLQAAQVRRLQEQGPSRQELIWRIGVEEHLRIAVLVSLVPHQRDPSPSMATREGSPSGIQSNPIATR